MSEGKPHAEAGIGVLRAHVATNYALLTLTIKDKAGNG